MSVLEFLRAGGPFMVLLVITSIVGVAFIIERGLALRRSRVIPAGVEAALSNCRSATDLPMLRGVCEQQPAPLSRLPGGP